MPEVIDLISSSPVNGLAGNSPKQFSAAPPNPNPDRFNFFDLSDEVEFPLEQPAKKRRTSPSRLPSKSQAFCLFSDDDLLPAGNDNSNSIQNDGRASKPAFNILDPPSEFSFSSSAPEPLNISKAAQRDEIEIDDEFFSDDDMNIPTSSLPARTHLSERTRNLLASIDAREKPEKEKGKPGSRAARARPALSEISSSPPRPKRKAPQDPEARAAAKVAAKAERDGKKDAEKERKRILKETKAKDKQLAADIAEVNRSKIDKKNSTPEMIVDLPSLMQGTSVGNQVAEYMKALEVECHFREDVLDLSGSFPKTSARPGHLIQWRRKVKGCYNEELGQWDPLPVAKVQREPHVLLFLTAQEFFEAAVANVSPDLSASLQESRMKKNLDTLVESLKAGQTNAQPILLIEGLTKFLQKNKTALNRAFTAAVRSQIPSSQPSSSQTASPKRKRKAGSSSVTAVPSVPLTVITPDISGTLLLHLQIYHPELLIHHTLTPSLSATQIRSFTELISTVPYRRARMATNDTVGFCMDNGQVRTGDGTKDTYVRMLQEVNRVTPSMAYGVAEKFKGVGGLIRGFRAGGEGVLSGVEKAMNRDGGGSGRALGPAVSRRLFKVWMGRREGDCEGIV